jgi:hypothetical protein
MDAPDGIRKSPRSKGVSKGRGDVEISIVRDKKSMEKKVSSVNV